MEKPSDPGAPSWPVVPWLSAPAIAALVVLCVSPLFWVAIPPLADVPGHTAAAAIAAARPGSALSDYYQWRWAFTLNMGGEVLMDLLGSGLRAGWGTTLIATGAMVAGALATIRTLNPRGAHATGWALIFLFGFPWLWGFLNFLLATGVSLLAFAAACRLAARPGARALLLIVAQPLALLCHAIGGLLLPLLIVTAELGAAIDLHRMSPGTRVAPAGKMLAARLLRTCWPLAATVATVALWKLAAPAGAHGGMQWDWPTKLDFPKEVLRDQDKTLDEASAYSAYALILFGGLLGARWKWRQALPWLAVLLLYALMPARIDGSEAVDTRLLPIALVLALGLQDWSGARPRVARWVALSGALLFAVRLLMITLGFLRYEADYHAQLKALDRVRPGSRMFVLWSHPCGKAQWRLSRLDKLPALASLEKQAWINAQWSVPGLDMLQSRYLPSVAAQGDQLARVWDPACASAAQPGLGAAIRRVPYGAIDYLWLMDTGAPAGPDRRLHLLWHWHRSYLYGVDPA